MKQFAIIDGDMFLNRIEFVEKDRRFIPIFSHEETWFDAKTAKGYIGVLLDDCNAKYNYYDVLTVMGKRSWEHEIRNKEGC